MKFIDEAVIHVKAGHGGSGSRHFRREKFIAFGGPDGGDGGRGGDVIVIADRNHSTLLDFQHRPHWFAENGEPGDGAKKDGKDGKDLEIKVPVGTQIFEYVKSEAKAGIELGKLICDLDHDGARIILAQGGRGGRGNAFFKSPTNRAPEHFQPGEEGHAGSYVLSLKLVAEVALVGFPNAGKSTLISRLSSAKSKIADYPFTTLTPVLGVVKHKSAAPFVIADVPGLIEGAHRGRGLGIKFLKHLERTLILIHLVDPLRLNDKGEPTSAAEAFDIINRELLSFSPELSQKPQIVAITKADSTPPEVMEHALNALRSRGATPLIISAVSGVGIEALLDQVIELLARHRSRSD